MIRKLWPGIVANALAAGYGLAMLHRLPERVASHWGIHGEVNGYSSRVMLVVMVPFIALLTAVLLAYAPKLDPKRRNFPLHAGAYWVVTNAVLVFLAATQVLLIGINLGWQVDISRIAGIGIGILFVILGNVMTRVRPNWIFGIRTPWTLSSELSWRETHRLGGYAFVCAGFAVLLAALARPRSVFIVMTCGIGVAAVLSIVWSYFAWKRDPNAQGREA